MSEGFDAVELAAQLDKIFEGEKSRSRQRRFVAVQGSASAESVTTSAVGAVRVVPVRSELELRRSLPGLHDEHPFTAFLLGWPAREVPVDIAGRFVRHGRVYRVGREDRIRNLFGGTRTYIDVDGELARSKFGAYLVDGYAPGHFESASGKITLDGAWAAWLGTDWGLDAGTSLGLDTLLAWAATNARGDQMRADLESEVAGGLQAELEAFLQRRVGDAGPVILRSWLAGRGRELLAFAALFEVAVDDPEHAPAGAIRSVALAKLGLKESELDAVLIPLGKGAGAAFREYARLTDEQSVRMLLSEAEGSISSTEHRGLAASARLPVAWSLRLDRLGEALRAAANAPSPGTFGAALDAFRGLEGHAAYINDDSKRTLERAEMAMRLLAWLVLRPDQQKAAGPQAYADAQTLGLWYAQEGGYVDWARRRARGGGDTVFSKGIDAVLAVADTARVELDRRFAQGYVEWLRSHSPAKPLLPIDAAVETFVAGYLDGPEHRRMLVLLMDGMAWAQAVELLESLGKGSTPWYPIAWNTMAFSPGNAFFTPVLAQLPSLTKVSRSAFFAGKATPAGVDTMKLDDAKLWEANKSLRRFYSGTEAPKLRLKTDGFNGDGTVTKPTLNLIQDESQPVVGLVINAIDDHLKTSNQEDHHWTVDRITALREILEAAALAGRAVLLAADHGHVSGQRLEYVGGQGNDRGTRWRPWYEGDSVLEYEVAVEKAYTWAPKGEKVQGIVLLADDTRRYGTQNHYGEHGGATLAEVVSPTFVIGTESLKPKLAESADPALETRADAGTQPRWWHLDVFEPAAVVADKPGKRSKSKAAVREDEGQLAMPGIKPVPAVAELAVAPTARSSDSPALHVSTNTRALLDKLGENPLFKARAENPARRALAVRALELLLERGNSVSAPIFAAHLGQPHYRVGGLVSQLGEVLNVDGYEVIGFDRVAKLVVLNAAQMKTGFGV